ncbi:MAG: acylneuraminate cytidylyltransferase family protein [Raineya sp.]|jgi:N-acylneuraminate cytidylyltransferase|nr:acylneuraminate cytidylyltransferase family protein [Raineya sp.]
MFEDTLFIIPARGGSKGIPQKNIKHLAGKPLIYHTIDLARKFAKDDMICVSTDSIEIKEICEAYGLPVQFLRPSELATDTASAEAVIEHAYQFYKNLHYKINKIVLLQPTSPFRLPQHLTEAMKLYHHQLDMVISVMEAEANPYFLMCIENEKGYVEKLFKDTKISRRQDAPLVYQYNGAIYIINADSFEKKEGMRHFTKIVKYEMDIINSVDLDTPIDWAFAEFILEKRLFQYE